MASTRVARRYARAAFDIAVAHNDLDGWLHDLGRIRENIGQPNILALLENPKLPADTKRRVIEELAGDVGEQRRNWSTS